MENEYNTEYTRAKKGALKLNLSKKNLMELGIAGGVVVVIIIVILIITLFGKTITYGEIAKILSCEHGYKKMSAQAVGHAVGVNPISIIIPCHRVIGANGNLTGYSGGLDIKVELLKHEQVDTNFYMPINGRNN